MVYGALVFVVATALTAGITRYFVGLAYHWRLVDRPAHRKTHRRPVAYLGGLSLFVGLSAGLAVALAAERCVSGSVLSGWPALLFCSVAALLAMGLGLADDLKDLRPRLKLLGQTAIAFGFALFGWRFSVIHLPGLRPFVLGWTGVPLSAFFMLAVANGMNMIDGSDALCLTVAAISLAVDAVAGGILGQAWLMVLALAAAGACLGLLFWNCKRRSNSAAV